MNFSFGRIWRFNFLIFGFLIACSLPFSSAHADYASRLAVLACAPEGNQFVVRFGVLWNEDTVDKVKLQPSSQFTEGLWKEALLMPEGKCTLKDGKKISLTYFESQSFAYGMGGADPDTSFTLSINDKHIYYKKKFYQGYGSGVQYSLTGVIYKGGSLIEDATQRLTNEELPPVEAAEKMHDLRRETLKNSLSPFCKSVQPELARDAAYSKAERIPNGFLSHLDTDINNDGKIDTVFRIGGGSADCGVGCGSHYFDGSFLIVFTNSKDKIPSFLKAIKDKEMEMDKEPTIKHIPEWDADFISINLSYNSSRYIYNTPITLDGKNYISTFEVSENAIPRRSLNEMTPDNKIKTICRYP